MEKIGDLYEIEIDCPICNNKFTTKRMRTSRLRLVRRDGDFLSRYVGDNPIQYNVYVCPKCGFAAPNSKFEIPRNLDRGIILDTVTARWNQKDFGGERTLEDSIHAYKLSLYIGEILGYKSVEKGGITLNIAWLYRIKGNHKEELRYLEGTKDLYEYSYENESLLGQPIDGLKMAYLLGEIYRRMGDIERALKWYNTVLMDPEINMNLLIKRMVRTQWELAREEQRNNKQPYMDDSIT